MKKTNVLSLALATAALAAPATALAAPADTPTATIGSVRGTGSSGCVKAAKTVAFNLNSIDSGYFITGARLTLDGKTIARKAWATPVAISAPPSPTFRDFSFSVNLRHVKAGRHRIGLYGNLFFADFARRHSAQAASTFSPAIPPSTTGLVRTSKIITKCATAVFTG